MGKKKKKKKKKKKVPVLDATPAILKRSIREAANPGQDLTWGAFVGLDPWSFWIRFFQITFTVRGLYPPPLYVTMDPDEPTPPPYPHKVSSRLLWQRAKNESVGKEHEPSRRSLMRRLQRDKVTRRDKFPERENRGGEIF